MAAPDHVVGQEVGQMQSGFSLPYRGLQVPVEEDRGQEEGKKQDQKQRQPGGRVVMECEAANYVKCQPSSDD